MIDTDAHFGAHPDPRDGASRPWLWIGLITLAGVGFSRAFACAMPFAAFATLAAMNMRRREGAALMAIVWLVSQAMGFLVLHYPRTGETYVWASAIGLAALLSFAAAAAVRRLQAPIVLATAGAFAVAFGVYEAALYVVTLALHAGFAAYTPAVLGKLAAIDVVALAGLLALNALAVRVRLIAPPPRLAFA